MTETDVSNERRASCGCGGLTVTTTGEPIEVYACSCLSCQKEGGGAFSYGAIFPAADVSISGERKAWRRKGGSGSWIETDFCPTCGVGVSYRMEAWPEVIGVSAGCFADPDFAKPEKLYWAQRRHRWLELKGIEMVDVEPA
jgi:hypothetical protein